MQFVIFSSENSWIVSNEQWVVRAVRKNGVWQLSYRQQDAAEDDSIRFGQWTIESRAIGCCVKQLKLLAEGDVITLKSATLREE